MTATTASRLIVQARADGLELVPNGDKLKLRGTAEVVERWKPRLAEHKAGILAALTHPIAPDLDRLIRRAAAYWQYSPDDLATIQQAARRDPEGLRLALEDDVAFRLPSSLATTPETAALDIGQPNQVTENAGPHIESAPLENNHEQ